MRDIYRWNPKESEYSASCQSNESEYVIKNFFIFLGVAGRPEFVWQKCGIFCLRRQEFDRIRRNGKKKRT